MLNVVKPRVLACALAVVVCAGAPRIIKAEEAGDSATIVIPATNRTSVNSEAPADTPLAIALAEIHGGSGKSKPSDGMARQKKGTSWPTPARFFTINQVIAKRQNGPSALEFASIRPTETPSDELTIQVPPTQGEEPFGLFTFKAPDSLVSMKWRRLQSEIEAEAPVIERCRTEPASCTPAAARFVAITKDAAGLALRAKLQLVNERVNTAIQYSDDLAQWHQVDVWSAPLDVAHRGSFETGKGDCEDYAIAKYVALREAGVAEMDLRILLVKDEAVHLDHAVLAVRDSSHWIILDNRWSRLADDTELRQFVPLFGLNAAGVKLFAAPYAKQLPAPPQVTKPNSTIEYIDAGLAYSTHLWASLVRYPYFFSTNAANTPWQSIAEPTKPLAPEQINTDGGIGRPRLTWS